MRTNRAWALFLAFWLIGLSSMVGSAIAQPADEAPKEEAPSAATPEKGKEAEAPPKPVKRDEIIATPGAAPREELKNYRNTKRISARQPSNVGEFEQMKRGSIDADPKVVQEHAQWHAAKMTFPGEESSSEVVTTIEQAVKLDSSPATEFLKLYKPAAVKALRQLLDNSIYVQVNALLAISQMQTGVEDTHDGVDVFLEILRDDSRPDAIQYMALKGMARAKDVRISRAEEEQEAVQIILKRLQERPDIQGVLKAKYFESLGNFGRAYLRVPEDAAVATVAASNAIDTDNPPRVRFEAARALARMDISQVRDWNTPLQVYVLAMALRSYLEERADALGNDAGEALQLQAYEFAAALEVAAGQRPNQNGPEFNEFMAVAFDQVLRPILLNQGVDLAPLDEWIQKHPAPQNHRLAPRAAEIAFPKPKEEPKEAEEAGEEAPADQEK